MKAIISGASKGIGKAITVKLHQLGFDLILIARRKEKLESLKNKLLLQRPDSKIEIFALDLSMEAEIEELKTAIKEQNITLIINNVGGFEPDKASQIERKKLIDTFNTNLFPAISITNALLPKMREYNNGHIFNICSVASINALEHASSYSISKAALKSWNDSLREELRPTGIKVTAIYPGSVNTSSWEGTNADTNKMIQTEDIVALLEACLKMSTNALCKEIHISPLNPL